MNPLTGRRQKLQPLIRKDKDGEIKYSLCHCPEASLKQLAYRQCKRYFVEKAFRDGMPGVYIDPVDAHTSRLLTRMLYLSPKQFTLSWWLDKAWFEWAHCIMQRGMIPGIKKRVEKKKTAN